jgi:NAD(P)-dependent dehydrogenase (short-subunit alcohol dehydrogenase family)
LADINQEALSISVGSLKKQFPNVQVLAVHLDVRDSTQVKEGIVKIIGEFGRLDIAVNNAGVSGSGRKTHELEDDEWLRILDVNLQGVYRCQKEELGVMVNQEYVYQNILNPNGGRAKPSQRFGTSDWPWKDHQCGKYVCCCCTKQPRPYCLYNCQTWYAVQYLCGPQFVQALTDC